MSNIIVITGGGAGLGRALALRFGADGDTVILLGRTYSKVRAVAAEIGGNSFAIECDVAVPDSVRKAFAQIAERHKKIDVLINNAAISDLSLLAEASDDHILNTISINLVGPLLCSRSAIAMMDRGGHIINVSSEALETPFPHHVVYQASKGGIEQMSFFLQKELATQGLRVSVVRAGQMFDESKTWDVDGNALKAFFAAAKERGIDLTTRPIAPFASVTGVFRSLVDLPPDVQVTTVRFVSRHP